MNESFDFFGKYWIFPDGGIQDVSTTEHAQYARARMLLIEPDCIGLELPLDEIFKPLTMEQASSAHSRGADVDAIRFLCDVPVDPRVYAIKKWNWIRQNSNQFWAWRWDEEARASLARSAFWPTQRKVTASSWAILYSLFDGSVVEGRLSALGIDRFRS